jgi:hypothetical protein
MLAPLQGRPRAYDLESVESGRQPVPAMTRVLAGSSHRRVDSSTMSDPRRGLSNGPNITNMNTPYRSNRWLDRYVKCPGSDRINRLPLVPYTSRQRHDDNRDRPSPKRDEAGEHIDVLPGFVADTTSGTVATGSSKNYLLSNPLRLSPTSGRLTNRATVTLTASRLHTQQPLDPSTPGVSNDFQD